MRTLSFPDLLTEPGHYDGEVINVFDREPFKWDATSTVTPVDNKIIKVNDPDFDAGRWISSRTWRTNVPTTRTIEINGVKKSLVDDVSFSISGGSASFSGTTSQYVRGDGSLSDFQQTVSNNVDVVDATAKKHTHANQSALNSVSGVNTGDQDLSTYATKTFVGDAVADKVTLTGVETLMNKTIDGSNNTFQNIPLSAVNSSDQQAIAIDSSPTASSGNLVSSGGVYTSLGQQQVADYVVTKSGSTITATARKGSGFTTYSGTDAYTVIQNAINALTASAARGAGGGHIHISSGSYSLSNELMIIGWETKGTGNPGYSQLTITGDGKTTYLTQGTTGKNGIVVKNNVSVALLDMRIECTNSSALSALRLDGTATDEISCFGGKFDNLYLISYSSTSPALYIQNIFDCYFGTITAMNSIGDAIVLENLSTTTLYGNSHFGFIRAIASSSASFAGLRVKSNDGGNWHAMNLCTFNNYECVSGYYGVHITDGSNLIFNMVDIEYGTVGFHIGGGTLARNNKVLGGLIGVNATTGKCIEITSNAGSNFFSCQLGGGASAIPISDTQTFMPPNMYDVVLTDSTDNSANISITQASRTFLRYRVAATGRTYTNLGDNATATTPGTGDNSTALATTAFVKAQGYAPLASPTFTGAVTLPSTSITGNLTLTGTKTASAGLGTAHTLSPTLTAAANNDILSGLDISGTFTNGAFTGVKDYFLRVNPTNNSLVVLSNGNVGMGVANPAVGFELKSTYVSGIGNFRINSDTYAGFTYNCAAGYDAGMFFQSGGNNVWKIVSSDDRTAFNIMSASGGDNNRFTIHQDGRVGINTGNFTSVDASAILEVKSTTKGFLPPRMTTAQRNAIATPATGLIVFVTDATATDASTGVLQCWNGSTWKNAW